MTKQFLFQYLPIRYVFKCFKALCSSELPKTGCRMNAVLMWQNCDLIQHGISHFIYVACFKILHLQQTSTHTVPEGGQLLLKHKQTGLWLNVYHGKEIILEMATLSCFIAKSLSL